MKKTIDFTKEEIEEITKYQKENKIKKFSTALKEILSKKMTDENFILIADILVTMNKKLDVLVSHMPPKSAGEVNVKINEKLE